MELLEIVMHHFGKFTEQTMTFHAGVNIIYGGNETGKSTMGAFIRGMLFGIDKLRGRGAQKDEYSVRQPWENGGYFAGTLRFASGGKVFRLQRNFDRQAKSASLVCETDGEELDVARGDLQSLLGGMDESVFDNTVFFGGTTGETTQALETAVRNYIVNANFRGAQTIDVAAAAEELKEQRKRLEKEKKQKLTEKIEKQQELSVKIDYARQEMEELAEEEQRCRSRLEELPEEELYDPEQFYEEFDRAEDLGGGMTVWKIGKIVTAVVAAAAMIAGVLITSLELRVLAASVILLGCLGLVGCNRMDQKDKEQRRQLRAQRRQQAIRSEQERQNRYRERARLERPKRQKLLTDMEWASTARKEKRRLLQSLEEERRRQQGERGEIDALEEELAAVSLAQETLKEVTDEIYREYGQKLNARISQILGEITGGKYTGVSLDEEFAVRIYTPRKVLAVWQVSRGTMEQIYFAIRMACMELMEGGERLPVILDDAFLTYDDARLERTLRWLHASGHQVLLFTCHKREQEIMQKIIG